MKDRALEKHKKEEEWNKYFIQFARFSSTKSKDPSNKVGSVIVKDKHVISTGYNGLPSEVDYSKERLERPAKYMWMCHAEENAIAFAAKFGISCLGATIYVTPFHPCARCARMIIQAGIKKVVVENVVENPRFEEEFEIAKEMFDCAGIQTLVMSA